jgi:hypothetical protein
MQTIVELPEFQRKSDKLLSDTERLSIIKYLATHPAAGDIMPGTSGIRKLRWFAQGKGQRAKGKGQRANRWRSCYLLPSQQIDAFIFINLIW